MPTFEIETPQGKFEIEADSQDQINTFLGTLSPQAEPETPAEPRSFIDEAASKATGISAAPTTPVEDVRFQQQAQTQSGLPFGTFGPGGPFISERGRQDIRSIQRNQAIRAGQALEESPITGPALKIDEGLNRAAGQAIKSIVSLVKPELKDVASFEEQVRSGFEDGTIKSPKDLGKVFGAKALDRPIDAVLLGKLVTSVPRLLSQSAREARKVKVLAKDQARIAKKDAKFKKSILKTNKLVKENETAQKAITNIKDNIEGLVTKKNLSSELTAKKISTLASRKAQTASRLYGKRLNKIVEDSTAQIRRTEIDSFSKSFKDRMEVVPIEQGGFQMPATRAMATIRKEADKIIGKGNIDDVLEVKKDLINFKRNVNKELGKLKGLDATERRVMVEFNKSFGDFLEDNGVGGLKELNQAYGPVVENLRTAEKAFRSTKGKGVVGRLAKGKGTDADKQLIQLLEEGQKKGVKNRFVSGAGELTADPKQIANRLKILTENNPAKGKQAVDVMTAKLRIMDEELARLEKLTQSDDIFKSGLTLTAAVKRINRIQNTKRVINGVLKFVVIEEVGRRLFFRDFRGQ